MVMVVGHSNPTLFLRHGDRDYGRRLTARPAKFLFDINTAAARRSRRCVETSTRDPAATWGGNPRRKEPAAGELG
jgi:hypothetical protein